MMNADNFDNLRAIINNADKKINLAKRYTF